MMDYLKPGLLIAVISLFIFILPVHASEPHLVLDIHPYKSANKLIKAYTPLAEYLSRQVGRKVDVQISPDYATHVDRIGKDQVGFAYMGPASYVHLVEQYGRKPIIARQYINGKPTFQGKIIVRENSAIKTLSDLNNKRFAFGDPESTMSHLVPRFMLLDAHVSLGSYKFLGSHDNVALGVLSGDYDAGAVKEAVFYKYESRGLRVLATTPELSEHLFVASNKLDKSLVNKLRDAFYDLADTPDGLEIMSSIKKGITSYGSATDDDYDNLRQILATLKRHGI